MTTDNAQLLDRAFPGESIPFSGSECRDMKCLECVVQWRSGVDGENCWVCGKEGESTYVAPTGYGAAIAAWAATFGQT